MKKKDQAKTCKHFSEVAYIGKGKRPLNRSQNKDIKICVSMLSVPTSIFHIGLKVCRYS